MKHTITRIAATLLAVIFNLTAAMAETPAGTKVYPKISSTQQIELIGGSTETATWPVPSASTYKIWVQIPPTSTASNATYTVYPNGNAVGNSTCSSTDPTYPCFQVTIDQATASNGWVQLKLNKLAATTWQFNKYGYVSTNASNISSTEQLGVAQVSFQSTIAPPPVIKIGQSYQGGKIFYIDSSKQHGLIAAPYDQTLAYPNNGIQWYNGSYIVTGAGGIAIGTGQANTAAIVKAQGAGSYAASLCDNLNLGGYTDWYLPSRDELNQLYFNKAVVGGFASGSYWGSSESDDVNAWNQHFGIGNQYYNLKFYTLAVRCIRSF